MQRAHFGVEDTLSLLPLLLEMCVRFCQVTRQVLMRQCQLIFQVVIDVGHDFYELWVRFVPECGSVSSFGIMLQPMICLCKISCQVVVDVGQNLCVKLRLPVPVYAANTSRLASQSKLLQCGIHALGQICDHRLSLGTGRHRHESIMQFIPTSDVLLD